MDFEIFLMAFLACFMVLAIALTISAWSYSRERHMSILAEAMKLGMSMAGILTIIVYTLWDSALDFTPYMGPISLQSLLLLAASALVIWHINDMEELVQRPAV